MILRHLLALKNIQQETEPVLLCLCNQEGVRLRLTIRRLVMFLVQPVHSISPGSPISPNLPTPDTSRTDSHILNQYILRDEDRILDQSLADLADATRQMHPMTEEEAQSLCSRRVHDTFLRYLRKKRGLLTYATGESIRVAGYEDEEEPEISDAPPMDDDPPVNPGLAGETPAEASLPERASVLTMLHQLKSFSQQSSDIVEELRNQEKARFESWVREKGKKHADEDAIIDEALLKIRKGSKRFNGTNEGQAYNFCKMIIQNQWLDVLRKEQQYWRHKDVSYGEDDEQQSPDDLPSSPTDEPEEILEAANRNKAIQRALERLSEEERELVTRVYLDGERIVDIVQKQPVKRDNEDYPDEVPEEDAAAAAREAKRIHDRLSQRLHRALRKLGNVEGLQVYKLSRK
jgi:DNA-directed RNA polymerase specialized sigma24 family protein